MAKELIVAQIAKEDHDNGECGSGCTHCHAKHQEFLQALHPPAPGFYARRYMIIGFRG